MAMFSKFVDTALYRRGFIAAGVICFSLIKQGYLPRPSYFACCGLTSIGAIGLLAGCVSGVKAEEIGNMMEQTDKETGEQMQAEGNEETGEQMQAEGNEETGEQKQAEGKAETGEQRQDEGNEAAGKQDESEEDEDPGFFQRMAEFYRLKPSLLADIQRQARDMIQFEIFRRRRDAAHDMEMDSQEFGRIITQYEERMRENPPTDADGQGTSRAQPPLSGKRIYRSLQLHDLSKLSKLYTLF